MTSPHRLTGRLVAAARALVEISVHDLAGASGLTVAALQRAESEGAAWLSDAETKALLPALESFGVVFVPEGDGLGAGVRLKFTRQDAKQIGRLEGEGGLVRSDDVP